MSLEKKFLKTKPVCKVKFSLADDAVALASTVALVGDFNDWSPITTPLKKSRTGGWSISLDFETGRSYQFRYLVNGESWLNEPQADGYVANGFGTDNAVLAL